MQATERSRQYADRYKGRNKRRRPGEFSRKHRLMNQAGSIVKNPYNIMVVISVIFMVYLILIPLGQMIIQTLTLAGADAARVDMGRRGCLPSITETGSDQQHFQKMLWTPLKNSLLISVCTAAFGVPWAHCWHGSWSAATCHIRNSFSWPSSFPYMIPS